MKLCRFLTALFALFFLLVPSLKTYPGNRELLQEWANRKEQIVKTVLEKLRKEGKLPENGVIKFTAKVKPVDTKDLDIKFESLEVIPQAENHQSIESKGTTHGADSSHSSKSEDKKAMEEIFRPRNPGPVYTQGEIKIESGKVAKKRVEFLDNLVGGGKADKFDEHHSNSGGEDVHPSWWQRFLRHMKIK